MTISLNFDLGSNRSPLDPLASEYSEEHEPKAPILEPEEESEPSVALSWDKLDFNAPAKTPPPRDPIDLLLEKLRFTDAELREQFEELSPIPNEYFIGIHNLFL